jgi:hypothetical protein
MTRGYLMAPGGLPKDLGKRVQDYFR